MRYASCVGVVWPRQLRRLSELVRFKVLRILNSKPRLTGIEDISEAKRKVKTTHVALDAVYTLNLKWTTSPSLTMYSFPSDLSLPASLAPCSPLQATKSS
ncbi:hypothetical protein SAMN05421783_104135 [Thiocapsa roseopersicina]|uniref:Uncharacterized protein n=1 Tax=Thiocapsa roseopersicina TaxID=1058 RepID=A0A1H2TRW6_THIRO|nr:hypothetical protein SAMN05421783_104135 [Thiocapsa roseopersicina]